MKNDAGFIAFFSVVGVAVAWFASAPLRRPPPDRAPAPAFTAHQSLYAEGVVSLAPGFTTRAPALFLIARPVEGGPPLAVKRFATPTFPLTFFLTAADHMMAGAFYEGDVTIVARLDADGSAGPVQAGDVEVSALVSAGGDRSLQLTLNGKDPSQK